MATKVAINGFGRIGRMVVRAAAQNPEAWKALDIVAVNDLAKGATLAHLFKYDSVHRQFQGEVRLEGDALVINGKKIKITSEKDPAALPWKALGVDIAIESTGRFSDKEKAAAHITAGAKKVIISAPAKNEDITIVIGVNDQLYDSSKHNVISNASCTTNCLAPVAKVIMEKFGLKRGLMTTIHSYTNDQRILDFEHSDLRRARAGALNMIPTSTGAAKAVGLVLPGLKGKLTGFSMRVPTPNVSVVDLVCDVEKTTTVEEVNAALKEVSMKMPKILGYTDEPLVSMDFCGDPRSSIVDAQSTLVIDGTMIKVIAWYDNEWGYSNRVVDLAQIIASKL